VTWAQCLIKYSLVYIFFIFPVISYFRMPRAKFAFRQMCPEEFEKLEYRASNVPFLYNDERLDSAPIDPDSGDLYPDLPQEVWDGYREGKIGVRFDFSWDGPYVLQKIQFYDHSAE